MRATTGRGETARDDEGTRVHTHRRSSSARLTALAGLLGLLAFVGCSCEPVPPEVIFTIAYVLAGILLWVALAIISAIACPIMAARSGRKPVGYVFLGLLLSIVGLVITVRVTERPFSTVLLIAWVPAAFLGMACLILGLFGLLAFVAVTATAAVISGATWVFVEALTSGEGGGR